MFRKTSGTTEFSLDFSAGSVGEPVCLGHSSHKPMRGDAQITYEVPILQAKAGVFATL
jgi:hypothetical protein